MAVMDSADNVVNPGDYIIISNTSRYDPFGFGRVTEVVERDGKQPFIRYVLAHRTYNNSSPGYDINDYVRSTKLMRLILVVNADAMPKKCLQQLLAVKIKGSVTPANTSVSTTTQSTTNIQPQSTVFKSLYDAIS